MSKKEHRNHALYALLAPRLLEIFMEDIEEAERPSFSKCRITPDGVYLDIFICKQHEPRELTQKLSKYAHELQKIIADAHILSRMPKIRFRVDVGANTTSSVVDILDDLRAKYDLS